MSRGRLAPAMAPKAAPCERAARAAGWSGCALPAYSLPLVSAADPDRDTGGWEYPEGRSSAADERRLEPGACDEACPVARIAPCLSVDEELDAAHSDGHAGHGAPLPLLGATRHRPDCGLPREPPTQRGPTPTAASPRLRAQPLPRASRVTSRHPGKRRGIAAQTRADSARRRVSDQGVGGSSSLS